MKLSSDKRLFPADFVVAAGELFAEAFEFRGAFANQDPSAEDFYYRVSLAKIRAQKSIGAWWRVVFLGR